MKKRRKEGEKRKGGRKKENHLIPTKAIPNKRKFRSKDSKRFHPNIDIEKQHHRFGFQECIVLSSGLKGLIEWKWHWNFFF
jgi:hypothetical protein